jgi:hypothetical protein
MAADVLRGIDTTIELFEKHGLVRDLSRFSQSP